MLQSKILIFLFQLVFVCVLVVACNSTTTITERSISTAGTVATLNTKGCVKIYDPNIDYFPEKVRITHATGFVVEYHKHYKVVNVRNPWRNADTTFQYVLVQCGTPVPEGFKETQVIKVPVNTVVSLSNTHLPHLEKLGLVDKLIGVSAFNQVNTPSVVQKIKAGKLTEVGNNASINVERLLELNPELVTTYGVGTEVDIYPKLLEAGLKVAINAEYMETSPLGKTEWLKFTALFFNHEAIAEQVFGEIANRYQALATKASKVKNRPTVFAGFNFKGTWYMPGGKSYMAKFLDDAKANYLWAADNSAGSLPLAFEAVFERAATADYWLNGSLSWKSLQQVITEDNRYADFTAVKKSHVFNNNARVNESGGNDYWESGISNPDLVLSDLIKILHPELLPAHKLIYYRQMNLSK